MPASLGGKSFEKVIDAYENGGDKAVEALLDEARISHIIRADAYMALARSLQSKDREKSVCMAHKSWETDPKPWRMKYLAYRMYEAGDFAKAEALMDMILPDFPLRDEEMRIVSSIHERAESKRKSDIFQQIEFIRILKDKISQLEKEYGDKEKRVNELEICLERTKNECDTGKCKIGELNSQLEELKQERDNNNKYTMELKVELEKIIKERNFSNKEVNTLKVRIEQKEKERAYSNQEADNLRSQLERKKMECDTLKQETDKLRIDIGEITDKHTLMCQEVGKLRIELNSSKNENNEFTREIDRLKIKIQKITSEFEECKREVDDLKVQFKQKTIDHNTAIQEIIRLKTEIDQVKSERDTKIQESDEIKIQLDQTKKEFDSIKSEADKLRIQLEQVEKEYESSKQKNIRFESFDNKILQLTNTVNDIKKITEKISGSKTQALCQEILYAETFNNTISDSTWLRNESFSPGRWAVGYAFLYALYRVLDIFNPQNILELGLGQTTKMLSRYAGSQGNINHFVVEHDKSWIEFFKKKHILSVSTKIYNLPLLEQAVYKDDKEVIAYSGFKETFKDKKFDFISIDGPFGYKARKYSRIDVLEIIPECLADSFVIFIDDSERPGEKNTISEFKHIFDSNKIKYSTGEYIGQKSTYIFTSSDLKFLCSM